MISQNATAALTAFYDALEQFYGPRNWWPGDTPFEVAVGAILTQNTSWSNVEKCIAMIKQHDCMDPRRLTALPEEKLKTLIRSSGYYNQKAKKLIGFLDFLNKEYDSDMDTMKRVPLEKLRSQLLALHGIGPETADSILLYALDKPVFVVDAYTRRVLSRHHLIDPAYDYETIRLFFEDNLDRDVRLYNEYHALIVNVGKDFCRTKPCCEVCPLRPFLSAGQ